MTRRIGDAYPRPYPPLELDLPYDLATRRLGLKVTEGEVEMRANHALEDDEVKAGYVLTCQSYPRTDKVSVDYDVGG